MSCVPTAARTTASTCCTWTPRPSRSQSSSLPLLALLFPGQASQAVGMGTDLREQFLSPRRLFEWPATAVGWRSNSSAAVIGLAEEAVQAIWADASQSDSAVEVANLNSPGQVLRGLV